MSEEEIFECNFCPPAKPGDPATVKCRGLVRRKMSGHDVLVCEPMEHMIQSDSMLGENIIKKGVLGAS